MSMTQTQTQNNLFITNENVTVLCKNGELTKQYVNVNNEFKC